jgi:hypothetical protein
MFVIFVFSILIIAFFRARSRWFYRYIYLHTPYWRAIRRAVGRRAGWMCQAAGCREKGYHLNAHHLRYRWWLEWTNLDDLVWLCPRHHQAAHDGTLRLKDGRWVSAPHPRSRWI